jgi:gliding motility-associated-like protein
VAIIVQNKVHIVAAGPVVITATQAGNGIYLASKAAVALTISKVVLTVKADNKTKKAGTDNPALTTTIKGFVNGESFGNLFIQPKISTTATKASKAGTYPIKVAGAVSNNYTFTYIEGKLTVTSATSVIYDEPIITLATAPIIQLKAVGVTPLVVNRAMSPNGDGVNDVFIIEGIDHYPDNKLMLMDANGSSIYETRGYDNATKVFDGHSGKTHAMQKAGTYFYVLEYKDKEELKRLTGYFLIKY